MTRATFLCACVFSWLRGVLQLHLWTRQRSHAASEPEAPASPALTTLTRPGGRRSTSGSCERLQHESNRVWLVGWSVPCFRPSQQPRSCCSALLLWLTCREEAANLPQSLHRLVRTTKSTRRKTAAATPPGNSGHDDPATSAAVAAILEHKQEVCDTPAG